MKKKYLFCTKAWFYLTELPLIFLLAISIYYNPMAKTAFKLVPLIVAASFAIVFILIYFFRVIVISYEEIRYRGPFSSRDVALINEGKTLIITMHPHANLKIDLWGNDGKTSLYESMANEPPIDIYLFRGRAIGGNRKVRKILSYFGVEESDINSALTENSFKKDYEPISISAEKREDIREIRIRINQTV